MGPNLWSKARCRSMLSVALVGILLAGCTAQPVGDTSPSTVATPISTSTTLEVTQETSPSESYVVRVRYRDSPVDLAAPHFDPLNTAGSSFVRGAWYDDGNDYMVIRLDATYYHYCGLPDSVWDAFASASSFGSFYNGSIKGRFDCRSGYVPSYD